MTERPSGSTAIPSSSVGPAVSCSGRPSGYRWRQRCDAPPAVDVKNIHLPSGDHAADVQVAAEGPTWRPGDVPSIGTTRHGNHGPSISETSTECPFEDRYERCAIPFSRAGTYTSRRSTRLSSPATTAMCIFFRISENISRPLEIHVRPDAFGSHIRGAPP